MGGTHVHHLNYGIFLLSAVGALLLFVTLDERGKQWVSVAYGFGMAPDVRRIRDVAALGRQLIGSGDRLSAVIVVLSLFGVIAFLPPLERFRTRHWTTVVVSLLGGSWVLRFAILVDE